LKAQIPVTKESRKPGPTRYLAKQILSEAWEDSGMGKHSKNRLKRVNKVAMGASAIGVATSVVGLAATQPQSISTIAADLTAAIVVGSSTNPTGAGVADFYGGRYSNGDYGDVVVVNFFEGPAGIEQALRANAGDGKPDVVLASGWGASNASQVLAANPNDPVITNTLWVLDNNLNIPNGGFATRYPVFSRLVLIDPTPTPTTTDATVIQTRYQYDINSDAPAYPGNPVAMANSLAAYLQGRDKSNVQLPVEANGDIGCDGCTVESTGTDTWTVTLKDGTTADVKKVGKTTYVTYRTDTLPLVAPLRDNGGVLGNTLADAVEPALTAVVNYGYPDNNPIGDPNELKPGGLVPTAQETTTFLGNFSAGVQDGVGSLGGNSLSTTSNTGPLTGQSVPPAPMTSNPLTNVLRTSPMFKPGTTSGDNPTSAGNANPVGTAVTSAVDNLSKTAQKVAGTFGTKPAAS
jgi:hypothetical protein